jgi:hypothetical protein
MGGEWSFDGPRSEHVGGHVIRLRDHAVAQRFERERPQQPSLPHSSTTTMRLDTKEMSAPLSRPRNATRSLIRMYHDVLRPWSCMTKIAALPTRPRKVGMALSSNRSDWSKQHAAPGTGMESARARGGKPARENRNLQEQIATLADAGQLAPRVDPRKLRSQRTTSAPPTPRTTIGAPLAS